MTRGFVVTGLSHDQPCHKTGLTPCQRFCILCTVEDIEFESLIVAAGVPIMDLHLEEMPAESERDVMTLAGLASVFGWRIVKDTKGGARFYAPDDAMSFTVPLHTNLSFNVYRQKVRTLMRHRGHPTSPHLDNIPLIAAGEMLIDYLKLDHSHAKVVRDAIAEIPAGAERAPSRPVEERDSAVPVLGKRRKRRIMVEQPWSAHGTVLKDGTTQTYPSEAVMERTWSDETKDYVCRWPGCDYTSDDSPRSVASHYTSHRRGEGRKPQPEPDGIDTDHLPRKTARVRRLKSEVQGALDAASAQGVEADAEWIAQWIIDHRVGTLADDRGDDGDTELSPEQIIDKIVALADRGRSKILREQIEALQGQIDGYDDIIDQKVAEQVTPLAESHALLVAQYEAAEARARSAESDLAALADMLNTRLKP